MRRYIAWADNGRDFFTFEFFSDHRANSKANIEDARKEYISKHGSKDFKILSTELEVD